MTVALNRSYQGFPAGTVTTFNKPTEDALIIQGIATLSNATPTTGTQTPATIMQGRAAVPIGASSVEVKHPFATEQSLVTATVVQAAADGTALRVERTVSAPGTFTIYLTAAATAITVVGWELNNVIGSIRN